MPNEGDVKSVYAVHYQDPNDKLVINCICESNTTATRIKNNLGGYGTEGGVTVTEFPAIWHSGFWCAPFRMVESSQADTDHDSGKALWDAAIAKAFAAGLTEADLRALGVKPYEEQ